MKRIIISFLLIIYFVTSIVSVSTGSAEGLPANFALNPAGTVATVALNNDTVDAAREFVQQLQANKTLEVSSMVYAPVSLPPYLILSGSPAAVQEALTILQKILPPQAPPYLVVISASLREMTETNSHDIGLNIAPTVTGKNYNDSVKTSDATGSSTTITRTNGLYFDMSNDMLNLNKALNNSKVLVASEVYTPNGIKTQISNVKSVPIFSTDNSGNVQTQYQNLETSISVVPTVLHFDENKPEESNVKVNVDVKVSIISGSSSLKSVSAPEYSVKTLSTTRVLPADNHGYIIGSFITDSDTKSRSGIPILGELPLLKYLFSQEHTSKQRNTAILMLSVRLLPVDHPPN